MSVLKVCISSLLDQSHHWCLLWTVTTANGALIPTPHLARLDSSPYNRHQGNKSRSFNRRGTVFVQSDDVLTSMGELMAVVKNGVRSARIALWTWNLEDT
ncbi:hypothetical protein BDD12DRAFT_828857 [Trichophaea hybrida]|nr:hypothetical protein BDD12DRAFT_828857 [Trichophaea hybrida]